MALCGPKHESASGLSLLIEAKKVLSWKKNHNGTWVPFVKTIIVRKVEKDNNGSI